MGVEPKPLGSLLEAFPPRASGRGDQSKHTHSAPPAYTAAAPACRSLPATVHHPSRSPIEAPPLDFAPSDQQAISQS